MEPWLPAAGKNVQVEAQGGLFLSGMNGALRRGRDVLPPGMQARFAGDSPSLRYSGKETFVSEIDRSVLKACVNLDLSNRSGLSHDVCAEFLRGWSKSAAARSIRSVALQDAAAERFGLERGEFIPYAIQSNRAFEGMGDREWGKLRQEADVFLAATYEGTQEYLKGHGVRHMTLFRGMRWQAKEDVPPSLVAACRGTGPVGVLLLGNPLSAFSADAHVATMFANQSSAYSLVLAAQVPVERIASLAVTGMGCFTEAEVIVVCGDMEAMAFPQEYFMHDDFPVGNWTWSGWG